MRENIFALSSGRPPAAISVIRISGPQARLAAERLCGALPEPRRAGLRALRHPTSGERIDDALVLRFEGPASSTGEDLVEFQCHGSRAVVDSLISALAGIEGFRLAEPGEFTRRAFENGRIDLTEAEGLADLLEAETEAQRKAALALAEGGLSKQVGEWQERLLGLSALTERAIDYDEDDEQLDPALVRLCVALADELQAWLDRPRVEPLRDGVLVVVAGPPNAGKSSLFNAIVGEEKVIVTDVPGTTRDVIELPMSLNGLPIRLADTAGMRDTEDPVEAIGVERASRRLEGADVALWLGDPAMAPQHPRLIKIHSKADLGATPAADALPVSSVTGQGISELLRRVEEECRAVLPGPDGLALNRRQAKHVGEACAALRAASEAHDVVILAEHLRSARSAFDRLTGRAGVEDVLDALFGRFCLGK